MGVAAGKRALVQAAIVLAMLAAAGPASAAPLRVGATARAGGAVTLEGQMLAGSVRIFVPRVAGARRAQAAFDGGRAQRLKLGRPLRLDTRRLADGSHRVRVTVTRRRGRTVILAAAFRVANHAAAPTLIGIAQTLHRIDLGTSLLYRLYANWADARLPHDLRGSGSEPDDGAAAEAAQALAEHRVRGRVAQRIAALIARPNAPGSAFALAGAHHARDTTTVVCVTDSAGWHSATSNGVRAWVPAGPHQAADAERVLEAATSALATIRPDMGSPLPDGPADCGHGNPDDLIDIYLIPSVGLLESPRETYERRNASAYAYARPVPEPGGCSGYVLLNGPKVANRDDLDVTVLHELFHVLQFARTCEYTWFNEASAEWAETHYLADNPTVLPNAQGFYRWTFQHAGGTPPQVGLCLCSKSYSDFVWPVFMTQESIAIGKAWDALRGTTSEEDTTNRLDGVLPFDPAWRRFAVRNLNLPYHERGAQQDEPLLTSQPGGYAQLRLVSPPVTRTSTAQPGGDGRVLVPAPRKLDATYIHVDTLPDKASAPFVRVSFPGLSDGTVADALLRLPGQSSWEHRRFTGDKLELCRSDAADDAQDLYVVLSHANTTGHSLQEFMKVESAPTCSDYGVTGHLTFTADLDQSTDPQNTARAHWSGDALVDVKYDPTHPDQAPENSSTSTLNGTESGTQHADDGAGHHYDLSYTGSYFGPGSGDEVAQASWTSDHVDVTVSMTASGTTSLHVDTNNSGDNGGGSCSYTTSGDYSSDDGTVFLANYSIPIPEHGGRQTISLDGSSPSTPFLGIQNCTAAHGEVPVTIGGTLTLSVPPR